MARRADIEGMKKEMERLKAAQEAENKKSNQWEKEFIRVKKEI